VRPKEERELGLVGWLGSPSGLILTPRERAVGEESNQKYKNKNTAGVSSFSALLNAEPDNRGYHCRSESAKDCHHVTFITFRFRPNARQRYTRMCVRAHWVHCRGSVLCLQRVKVFTVVLVAEVKATAIVTKPISDHSARFTRMHYFLSIPDELTGYSQMLRFMYRSL
jgi:hypothetical protein